nr:MAG TPA: hypothetical protein [Caudoviricetes sp.]
MIKVVFNMASGQKLTGDMDEEQYQALIQAAIEEPVIEIRGDGKRVVIFTKYIESITRG